MTKSALVIIDMQMDMQHRIEAGRDHVNPEAPARIADLAAAFRRKDLPVLHIRHADESPASSLHPEAPGYRAMPCAESLENEPVFVKKTSSGFTNTGSADYLRENSINDLVVTGAVAGFCVNSTVRAGSDLGFTITVVRDAVLGFDLPSARLSARSIFDVTIAHLESDFAKVIDAASLFVD